MNPAARRVAARLPDCSPVAAVKGSAREGGHLYRMITARHFAPGNAGVIFDTGIFIPVGGFMLLRLRRRCEPEGVTAAPVGTAIGRVGRT